MKKALLLLISLCACAFAQTTTTSTREPDNSVVITFKNVSVPTSPTSLTTTQYRIMLISLINNNASAVHCTIKDQDVAGNGGAASLIPDGITIAGNSQFISAPLVNVVANGGITWSCDTTLVVGRIVAKP